MKYLVLLPTIFVGGCVTTSGSYTVTAKRGDETLASNTTFIAQGSGIYTARNALCKAYPGATIITTNNETKREHSSESPYQCK
jgi:hypothetical protein